MDGWIKQLFVSHGNTVDGGVNDFFFYITVVVVFLKIKLQIDIQDNVR